MSVTVRFRKSVKGFALYLDIYQKGKRSYEHSGLTVTHDYSKPLIDQLGNTILNSDGKPKFPRPTPNDKLKIEIIEKRRLQFELQLKSMEYEFIDSSFKNESLLNYIDRIGKRKNLYHAVAECFGKTFTLSQINALSVRRFIEYLKTSGIGKNTQSLYYNSLVSVFNRAKRDLLIVSNPCDSIGRNEKPRLEESKRDYLLLEEVAKLQLHPPSENNYQVKEAFLFACMTGLRISDVLGLKYSDIKEGRIQYRMQKVKEGFHYLPLSAQAMMLINGLNRDPKGEKVFWELNRIGTSTRLQILKDWSKDADIKKHVTWHVARHTCATLLLTNKVDIYTVSKILGHSSVRITERYAKIIDQKKVEAVNSIPNFTGINQ